MTPEEAEQLRAENQALRQVLEQMRALLDGAQLQGAPALQAAPETSRRMRRRLSPAGRAWRARHMHAPTPAAIGTVATPPAAAPREPAPIPIAISASPRRTPADHYRRIAIGLRAAPKSRSPSTTTRAC